MNVLEARRRLLGADVEKKTAEGNPISVRSLARMYPGIGMEGWTEQASTTGAQILNIDSFFDNSSLNTSNGSIVEIENRCRSDYIYLPEGEYTISREKTDRYWKMCRYDSNKVFKETIFNQIGINVISFSVNKNECIIIAVDKGKESIKKEEKIMLNTGSSALPYEPYTGGQPSPSPNYPQEIVNAGKFNDETQKWEYEIEISGANLFDIDDNEPDPISPTILRFKCHLKEGMTYILSTNGTIPIMFKISNTRDGCNSVNRDNVTEPQTFVMTRNEHISETNEQFIFMWIQNNVEVNDISMIKGLDIAITPGSAALPYEPYKTPQTLTLQSDRPLTKWDRLKKRDGQWGWVYKSLIVEFDGSDDEGWFLSNQPTIRPDLYILKSKIYENVKLQGESYVDAYTKSDNKQMEQDKRFYDMDSYFGEGRLVIKHDEYSDIAEWKTHLSEHPITWVVKTETETFVPLTKSEQSALNALHTNYPTTVLMNDQGCNMKLTYKTKKGLEIVGGGKLLRPKGAISAFDFNIKWNEINKIILRESGINVFAYNMFFTGINQHTPYISSINGDSFNNKDIEEFSCNLNGEDIADGNYHEIIFTFKKPNSDIEITNIRDTAWSKEIVYHNIQFWDGDTLVRDYIPYSKNADYMYDRIGKRFIQATIPGVYQLI